LTKLFTHLFLAQPFHRALPCGLCALSHQAIECFSLGLCGPLVLLGLIKLHIGVKSPLDTRHRDRLSGPKLTKKTASPAAQSIIRACQRKREHFLNASPTSSRVYGVVASAVMMFSGCSRHRWCLMLRWTSESARAWSCGSPFTCGEGV